MIISEARSIIASAVEGVQAGFSIEPRQTAGNRFRLGDGWVNVAKATPGSFRTCIYDMRVVLILGPDTNKAEQLLDDLMGALMDALTMMPDLPAAGVSIEPATIPLGDTGGMTNCLICYLTVEV